MFVRKIYIKYSNKERVSQVDTIIESWYNDE